MKIRRLVPALSAVVLGLLAARAQAANTWIIDCAAGTITDLV